MNYIKKLTQFFNKASADPNLRPTHISLFMALFQYWNQARFPQQINITRDDLMHLSKIHSKATYHKTMTYLHQQGYINYQPSYNPLKGSVVSFLPVEQQTRTINKPVHHLTTRPINEPYNKLYSTPLITDKKSTNTREEKKIRKLKIVRFDSATANQQKEKSCAKKEKEIPPAAPLIEAYFLQQQSSHHEAHRFLNHYTANGWLVGGKSPMKDWQASARNWIANSIKFNNYAKQDKSKPTTAQQLHTRTDKNYFEPL